VYCSSSLGAAFYIPFNQESSGAVTVNESASLEFAAGGTSSGPYRLIGKIVRIAGNLRFSGGRFTWNNGTSFSGPGPVILENIGTSATIPANVSVTADNFRMENGSGLQGKGSLTINSGGKLIWKFAIVGGGLALNISAKASLEVQGEGGLGGLLTDADTTLNNAGTVALNGQGIPFDFKVQDGAIINNRKDFFIEDDSNIRGTANSVFNNLQTGVVFKSGGEKNKMSTIAVPFMSLGRVFLFAGTLKIPTFTMLGRGFLHALTRFEGGKLDTDGLLRMEGGLLENVGISALDGEIFGDVLNTGGTIRPGGADSPGILTIYGITGSYTQSRNGTLAIDIFGPTPGLGYDQLRVTGPLELGGHLKLNASSGFTGNSFTIIDNQGSGPVSGTFADLPDGYSVFLGSREFSIDYQGGDGNDVVLTAVNPVLFATTTSLRSDPTTSVAGQAVTFTAVVAAAASLPQGDVTFFNGSTLVGTAPLVLNASTGTMEASFTTALDAGSHAITAIYNGNADFDTSQDSLTQTVDPASTETVLTSSATPVFGEPETFTAVFGEPVTFTATVSTLPPDDGLPTGTVTFLDTFNGETTVLSVGTLGEEAPPFPPLEVGIHTITAVYSGDANHLGSTSNSITQIVTAAGTTTALFTDATPVPVEPGHYTAPEGVPINFFALVSVLPPGLGTPTGTVTFYDASEVLSVTVLNGPSEPIPNLSVGDHIITAVYSGDGSFLGSSSTPILVTITDPPDPPPPTTMLGSLTGEVPLNSLTFRMLTAL
jgi:hypothetical protein